MTTTNHPSGLPEQEPTSPTAAEKATCTTLPGGSKQWRLHDKLHRVDGPAVEYADGTKMWYLRGERHRTDGPAVEYADGRKQWYLNDKLLTEAENGGAALVNLADLPTRLTGAQKEVIRSTESKFLTRGRISKEIRNAFPEVFADDRVTATWKSGDSDDVWAELLRVARMDGASVVGTKSGVTYSGLAVAAHSDHISIGCTSTGGSALALAPWGVDWAITVTAPKPVDPTGGDPVVRASLVTFVDDKKCIFFRARDGRWTGVCGSERGTWGTAELAEIERLSAQTIAELMGGAK